MKQIVFDVIVIGAGQAGLSASYYLKKYGLTHIVLERGEIGESWCSQRWDSFAINSPNRLNILPGDCYRGTDPDGFCSGWAFALSLKEYAATFKLPVIENAKVISIEKSENSSIFKINFSKNGNIHNNCSRQVIIASGMQNEIKILAFAKNISSVIKQLHASEYRNPDQLPDGGVLVVGSAQSGCQIAEDLVNAGRKVYLSTSMVARVPRRYRGKDIHDWLIEMKFFDLRTEDVPDPAMLQSKAPQLTGVDDGKRTISLQSLAKKGVIILGKLENVVGKNATFQPNATMHVRYSDEFSNKVKNMINEFIQKNQILAPNPEFDEADVTDLNASCANPMTSLNLLENNVHSIIWATGFKGDFNYIKLPVLDDKGIPQHKNGLSDIGGLYFLGFPWLRAQKSALIFGIKDDAKFIAEKVYTYSRQQIESLL